VNREAGGLLLKTREHEPKPPPNLVFFIVGVRRRLVVDALGVAWLDLH